MTSAYISSGDEDERHLPWILRSISCSSFGWKGQKRQGWMCQISLNLKKEVTTRLPNCLKKQDCRKLRVRMNFRG